MTRPDLEAIRENWRHDVAIGSDVPTLLAYVEELEAEGASLGDMLDNAHAREDANWFEVKRLKESIEALTQERDEERMRTRCFEQAMAEAQADSVDHLFRRLQGTVCAFKVDGEMVMVPGEEVARCLARFLCLIELA